jgi:hypothetical protein
MVLKPSTGLTQNEQKQRRKLDVENEKKTLKSRGDKKLNYNITRV